VNSVIADFPLWVKTLAILNSLQSSIFLCVSQQIWGACNILIADIIRHNSAKGCGTPVMLGIVFCLTLPEVVRSCHFSKESLRCEIPREVSLGKSHE